MTAKDTTYGTLIRIVDPASEFESENLPLAPRLASLKGIRLGVIDNSKHMASSFLDATKLLLKERYGVNDVQYYKKVSASVPTPPEIMESMVQVCDAVVHGVAD